MSWLILIARIGGSIHLAMTIVGRVKRGKKENEKDREREREKERGNFRM